MSLDANGLVRQMRLFRVPTPTERRVPRNWPATCTAEQILAAARDATPIYYEPVHDRLWLQW